MLIEYLQKSDTATLRTISEWIFDEFCKGKPNQPTIEQIMETQATAADSTSVPLMLVAFNEKRTPIGIAGLFEFKNKAKDHPELTPWVGPIVVVPELRGRGLAKTLCRKLDEEIRRLGYAKAYLCTIDKQNLYLSLGWKELFVEEKNGQKITTMILELS